MNENDAMLWREHRIPAILMFDYRLHYGYCHVGHNQIEFHDAFDEQNLVAQVSLHQIESMNVSTIQITKLQIVRDAAYKIQTDDFDNQASTFSQSLAVTPTSHEKYFDKRLLLSFGSDPINTLNQLSGYLGSNAVEIVDDYGYLFIILSISEYVGLISSYVFAIIRYNKEFQQANRLLPNVVWNYRMSQANVNFPLKIPISVDDFRHLKYDYCKRALSDAKMMKRVDESIDNLIRCVCTGISRKGSTEYKQLFVARPSHIITSFGMYVALFPQLPAQLHNANVQVMYNFSNGQGLSRLFSNVCVGASTVQLGVAAFLNTDYRRASISCYAEFSPHVMLVFRTVDKEVIAVLFDRLDRTHCIFETSVRFINLSYKRCDIFEECAVSADFSSIQVLTQQQELLAYFSADLSEIVSAQHIFIGTMRTNRVVAEIAALEAWRFIL